jgi:hypothetical protein
MVLVDDRPRQAEDFYRQVLGTTFECCDFLTASESGGGAPQPHGHG